MQVLFRTLGPLEVHTGEVHQLGAGKPASVLATLLQQPNAWISVDQLLAATWPGPAMPASASSNLKTYVWQLRRLLPDLDGASRIERRADAYRLRVLPGEVDADRARQLAAAARGLAAEAALPLVEEALGLWHGRPFSGLESAAAAAASLDELQLQLREQLARLQLELGQKDKAVGTLRRVTGDAPLREPAWAQLAHALHESGRRTEALIACRRAADVLHAELGVTPGPALAAAQRAVLGGGATRRELPRDVRLIGRTAELTRIRRAGREVVVIEGPAGIGKTALAVHAAHSLAPAHPDGQLFVSMRLGAGALLDRLLRGVGVLAGSIPSDLDEKAALWRSEVAQRRVLLVLDDADGRDQVWPLLPAGAGTLTLITARRLGGHVDGAARLPLGPLGPAAAAALFATAGGVADSAIRGCGGNPAALLRTAAVTATTRRRVAV
ncbi:BTAD domain-containing putative transcriptional regulator [Actinoplanes sp. NPDC051633]|uniref:BTAD domain-containing putative transcriptional regulator n=1 Tax=Actinoplanes sp. NPDC051633 TaxID=3155670 RepID=UPI003445304D